MADRVTATELRQHLARLLDRVLETGEPVALVHKGRRLWVTPEQPVDHLAGIVPIPGLIAGDPEALVEADWSTEWNEARAIDP